MHVGNLHSYAMHFYESVCVCASVWVSCVNKPIGLAARVLYALSCSIRQPGNLSLSLSLTLSISLTALPLLHLSVLASDVCQLPIVIIFTGAACQPSNAAAVFVPFKQQPAELLSNQKKEWQLFAFVLVQMSFALVLAAGNWLKLNIIRAWLLPVGAPPLSGSYLKLHEITSSTLR